MAAKKEVSAKEEKIRVLSRREGAVKCPDGTLIKYEDVIEVTQDIAEWLEATFGELFKRV